MSAAKAAGGVVAEAVKRLQRWLLVGYVVINGRPVDARDDVATILDALAAAQAREAGLRELLNRLENAGTSPFLEDFTAEAAAICLDYRALNAPTPEAPDHDTAKAREGGDHG